MLERVPKYTLRKLSVGLASVMIGSGILMNSPKVLADTTNSNDSEPSTQSSVQNTDSKAAVQKSNSVAETANELKLTKASGGAPDSATTTNAEEKVVATNPQDKDKQTNANETTQNTTGVGKKDTEVTPTNDATTPATPKTTAAPDARTAMKAAARPKTTAKFRVLAALPKMKEALTAETPDPTVPDKSANLLLSTTKMNWLMTGCS